MEIKSPYGKFLQWLQEKHADLYACCWDSFIVSDHKIVLNENGLEPEQYKQMVLAIEEYYGVKP